MYLFIFEEENYVKLFIKKLLKEKKLYLDDKILELPNIKKEDIEYVLELGRGIVPIDKKDRDRIYENSENAKKLIENAKAVFLIRKNFKKQIL